MLNFSQMNHTFHYDLFLVFVSFAVAIFSSFVALDLTRTVPHAKAWTKSIWLSAAALVMGLGIWSMHFIGMIAFHMPGHHVGYEIKLLILSILIPMVASGLAFSTLNHQHIRVRSFIWRGSAMAIAIAGMHYTGMYSMVMPFTLSWDWAWVAVSLIIAFIASFAALYVAVRLRTENRYLRFQILASVLLGIAISGMHYSAMEAARFNPAPIPEEMNYVVVSDTLGLAVTVAMVFVLCIAFAGAIIQRALHYRTQDAEESKRLYHESTRELTRVQEENEKRFELLVESIKDHAIFMLTTDGKIQTWNRGAQSLHGFSGEEILNQSFSTLYPHSLGQLNKSESDLAQARTLGSFQDDGWKVRKDGTRYWASTVITSLFDSKQQLIGYSVVLRDLSERKRTEEQLLNREAQLNEAQSMAQMGSWEWDIATGKIFWSDELYKIQDVDPQNFVQSYQDYLNRMPQETRELVQRNVQKCLETGKEFSFEHQMKHRDGSFHFIHSRGRAVRDEAGKIIKLRGTSQDITDRKLIEQQLMAAQSDLEHRVEERTAQLHESLEREKRATEAKMQFLANMSHEIRTPMNAIIGFTELLEGTQITEEQSAFLSRVKTNSGHLLRLIDDILDLSKFEAGRFPIEKTKISLSLLLEDLLHSFALEAEKKGLSLQVLFRTAIPQYIVSDTMRLRQILTNLLGNAIKFSRTGEVQLHLTYLKPDANSDLPALVIDVEDKGIGISEEDQKKLFQPFSQADSSVVRRFGGTGLGLALSRRIAEAMGGQLVLSESRPGVGSRFRLTLYIEEIQTPMISNLNAVQDYQQSSIEQPRIAIQNARVLLAEDSVDNEILIRSFLQAAHIKIDVANNGLEALEMALRGNYDCILMDIQMPKMDGLEATKQLRSRGFKKPIIALTAHALMEEVDRSLAAGCDIHLTKPINRKLLLETIYGQLQKSQPVNHYIASDT